MEPIAIIGMAGRFPGAPDVESFWGNLRAGIEGIRFFTDEELRAAGVPESAIENPRYVRARGLLDGIDLFDAGLFGFSPSEAELLDPQQRIFLECAWEALERAGFDPQRYPGAIGVFAGCGMNSYLPYVIAKGGRRSVGPVELMLSADKDHLATRLSYKLNLRGPSVTVQTACSTSLVAVHLACQTLEARGCDMALAGGVAVSVPQITGYPHADESILSPDGHCRPFDARARGTVPGSGAGIVVLKRLADAVRDGDRIHAVIRGSAITNDGAAKVGYTAPGVDGQARAIALAQAAAGCPPDTIGYVEAHGTATVLGDPIEVRALGQVFGASAPAGSCAIGSVKSNVGHLDAAAGIAGLIKGVLAVERGEIPPVLHFESPNPELRLDSTPFYVNTVMQPWRRANGKPRRAGVSSFGLGGTNAHVVIEEAPPREPGGPSREWQVLTVSGRSETSLDAAGHRLVEALKREPDLPLADAAFTLHVGRQALRHRRAIVCRTAADAIAALESRDARRTVAGAIPPRSARVVFMFPGQGSQYVGMGRELYGSEAAFRQVVDACAERLKPLLGVDIREAMFAPEEPDADAALARTSIAQAALFTTEIALARLYMSWGIEPAGFIGHSIGEYVAACLSGVWSLEDALTLVAARGQAMESAEPGAMLAVSLPAGELACLFGPRLSIAAENAPHLSVASGTLDAIAALEAKLTAKGVECRRLHTSHAFHSDLMAPVVDQLRKAFDAITPGAISTPFISNLTGRWSSAEDVSTPEYWLKHLTEAVQFSDGLSTVCRDLDPILLECGPGRTLAALARQNPATGPQRLVVSSLRHPHETDADQASVLRALAAAWTHGVDVDWTAFHAGERRRRVELPTYPFERQRYWIDPAPTAADEKTGPRERQPIADWFYVPSWKRTTPSVRRHAEDTKRWLVLADHNGFGDHLVSALKNAGHDVFVVYAGDRFRRSGDAEYVVSPAASRDYAALFGDLQARGALPDAVAHCFDAEAPGYENRSAMPPVGFASLLALAQGLGEAAPNLPLAVNVIASGVFDVTGREPLTPLRATSLGPVHTIGYEYANVRCRLIDLELRDWPAADDRRWTALVAELSTDAPEKAIALRGGHRWAQTFEPSPLPAIAPGVMGRLRDRGTYLITGAFGGIGRAIAADLARTRRARLVLTGRRPLSENPAAARFVAELEELGAEVLVRTADVTDPAAMQEVIAAARERFGALNGVVHAAGIAGGGVIQLKTMETAAAVLSPKVRGADVLAEAVAGEPLDFLLLCSSITAIVGAAGQVDYFAANAYLDAFAREHSRRTGTFTVAVNWDTWRDAGMAVDSSLPDSMRAARDAALAAGIGTAEGVDAFDRILHWCDAPQVIVSTRRLSERAAWTGVPPPAAPQPENDTPAHERPVVSAAYVAPRTETERIICKVWQDAIGVRQIGVSDDFFELGGHSLLALRITTRLRDEHAIDLSLRHFFEAPSVAALAGLLEGDVAGAAGREDREEIEIL